MDALFKMDYETATKYLESLDQQSRNKIIDELMRMAEPNNDATEYVKFLDSEIRKELTSDKSMAEVMKDLDSIIACNRK